MSSNRKLEHPSGMAVELLDSMGNDLSIVNAARVSYGKESEYEWWRYDPVDHRFKQGPYPFGEGKQWFPCLSKADAGLLNYLMRERHGTPFEMVQLKFRVKAPIGVVREWQRHRIGSFNEMSTRYVEWSNEAYIPQEEDWRTQIGKTGHYLFTHLDDEEAVRTYVQALKSAFTAYEDLIDAGLAKEVARNVLPLGAMTEMVWSVNVRSLLNFLSLRTAPNALREIQICARMVEKLTESVVPETLNLWRRHGRGAP